MTTSATSFPIGAARATDRFRRFHRTLSELWEGYELQRAILPAAAAQLKSKSLPPIQYRVLSQQKNVKPLSLTDSLGVIDRFQSRTMPVQTLIQVTSALELLLADLAHLIYAAFPADTLQEQNADGRREAKLISIILESADRDEILDRIIEEKIRASTYGSPREVFLKDSLRLRFGRHFDNDHESLLQTWADATGRRNVWVHNDGRVDRKYLRENADSGLKAGRVATIDEAYLVQVFLAVRQLGACAAATAVRGYFGVLPRGKLGASYRALHK